MRGRGTHMVYFSALWRKAWGQVSCATKNDTIRGTIKRLITACPLERVSIYWPGSPASCLLTSLVSLLSQRPSVEHLVIWIPPEPLPAPLLLNWALALSLTYWMDPLGVGTYASQWPSGWFPPWMMLGSQSILRTHPQKCHHSVFNQGEPERASLAQSFWNRSFGHETKTHLNISVGNWCLWLLVLRVCNCLIAGMSYQGRTCSVHSSRS